MNFKIFINFAYLFLIFLGNSYSAIYYVSASGNDNNNGTNTSTPWKTISKVNSMMPSIVAGDQILFKRGDTFFGTLQITKAGTAGNEIVFGSYGSGSLPVLTGKKEITGWTVHSGNIYKATLTDTISHLYINNKIMTIARYPNSGYLFTDVGNNKTGFYDAALNQGSGYWVGANCKLRTVNWTYEIRTVSAYGNGNVTFGSQTVYTIGANWGYYFDNKLTLLDAANEWYQDKATGIVYFYAPGGVNPNSIIVEAVVQKNIIQTSGNPNYLQFKYLKISGAREIGLEISLGNNHLIQGCYFNQTGSYGVKMNGLNNVVDGNTFEDNLNTAFSGVNTNGIIKNNTVNRTGLIAGYGATTFGYNAFETNICPGTIIEYNNIDSSGYNGISVARSSIVRYNIIDYSCLVLNDGAGIDITDCDTLKVLNNIVSNTIGNFQTSGIPNSYSCGIYVNGALMKNTTIQGNTCYANRYMGILVDHKNTPSNNIIIDNVCYNNFVSQILFTDYSAVNYVPSYNTNIKRNVFYSLSAQQTCMEQRVKTSPNFSDYGNFDSNYYCNPYSDYVIRRTNSYSTYTTNVYTFPYYKTTFNEDPNSKASLFTFSQYGITDSLSGNLISNSRFATNLTPWYTWPYGSTIAWVTHPLLDTGAMRIRWTGQGNSQSLTLSPRYSIVKGQYYLVNISAVGNHSGTFNLWGRSSLDNSLETFPQKFFSYENYRMDYHFTFKADTTDPQAYLSVGMILPDTLVYVDNVKVYWVNIDKIDSTKKSKLFINPNNYQNNISLGGIAYKDLDGNPVSGGSVSLQPYSSKILIDDDFVPSRHLQLKVLTEGLYDAASDKMIEDSCEVFLRGQSSPYSIVDAAQTKLDSNGNGGFTFLNAVNSTNYYIVVKHRNSLETWSKLTSQFSNDQLTYDFTTSAAKAYGDNMKQKGSRFCVYSGEVNNDGVIDVADMVQIYNQLLLFTQGYVTEDIDGDNFVDVSDLNIAHSNSLGGVGIIKP